MKKVYESFEELADAMCMGEGILHAANCAASLGEDDPCIAWQNGVKAFAEWLDHIGCKVEIADGSEDFYNFMSKSAELAS